MKIDNNPIEKAAMEQFHQGNRQEGLRLHEGHRKRVLRPREECAAAFRAECAENDHGSCQNACRYHGNCKECVAIHRAHQEHVPNCMRPMLNAKLKLLSQLTEHTLANEIEAPREILRKDAPGQRAPEGRGQL